MDPDFPGGFSHVVERYGRHEETRTPDLYRVNSEVNNLKPFACLAFPHRTHVKTARKQPSFGDGLVTSFSMCLPSYANESRCLAVRPIGIWFCAQLRR